MADKTAEAKSQPVPAELAEKVTKLTTQVENDVKAASVATDAFSKAVKSGDVDRALELADARASAAATVTKTEAQLKTAQSAVKSAEYAINAERIAIIHDQMRSNAAVVGYFEGLELFGVSRLVLERSEETGKIIVNSSGPKAPKRSGGGGGNGRGQPVTVNGEGFASANAALKQYFPDSGPLNRESILSKLTNAGHEVS